MAALNTFVALATLVLIGFELMSFAWTGPAGLVVAAIAIVIVLIQFIWNLIDPPKPDLPGRFRLRVFDS